MVNGNEPSGRGREGILLIGPHRVDTATGDVSGPAGVARLEPKVLAVLMMLVEHRAEVVSKRQLLRTVWSDTVVGDDVVWRCIAALRRTFGDDRRASRVIETLPRRGYRLIANVTGPAAGDETHPTAPVMALPSWAHRPAAVALLAATAATAMLSFAVLPWGIDSAETAAPAPIELAPSTAAWTAADFVRVGREYYQRRDAPDLQRAIGLFERSVEIDARHAPGWAGLADARAQLGSRLESGRWAQQAIAAAERAVRLDPRLAEAHKSRGLALATLGRTTEAMAAYRRAIDLAPGFGPAVANLGVLLAERGQFAEALALYTSVETRGLARAIDLHNIGEALYHVDRLEEARQHLEAALRVDPLQVDSIALLARLDAVTGNLPAGRARVRRALDEQPGNRPLLVAAGELATLAGDLEGARIQLEAALSESPADRDVEEHVRLAWVRRQLGASDGTDHLLRTYAEALPAAIAQQGSWRLAQLAAAVALIRGDRQGAIESLRSAVTLGHIEYRWLPADPVFRDLWDDPEFRRAVDDAASRWQSRSQLAEQAPATR